MRLETRGQRLIALSSFAVLFSILPFGYIGDIVPGVPGPSIFVIAVVLPWLIYLVLRQPVRYHRPFLVADLMLIIYCLAGIPGAFSQADSIQLLAYVPIQLMRNFLLFFAYPAYQPNVSRAGRTVLQGLLFGATVANIGSLLASINRGMQFLPGERLSGLGEGWMHANTLGNYAALAVLLSLILPGARWPRVAAGALGSYILLLSQSRGAILSLLVAILVWKVLTHKGTTRLSVAVYSGLAIILMLVILNGLSVSVGPVDSIVARFISSKDDITVGRLAEDMQIVQSIERSLAFGSGFRAANAMGGSGVANILAETGIIGLGAYTLFLIALLRTFALKRSALSMEPLQLWTLILLAYLTTRGFIERCHLMLVGDPAGTACLMLLGMHLMDSCSRNFAATSEIRPVLVARVNGHKS